MAIELRRQRKDVGVFVYIVFSCIVLNRCTYLHWLKPCWPDRLPGGCVARKPTSRRKLASARLKQ
eukprot:4676024-Heterocapsa_arctica.AAC.1